MVISIVNIVVTNLICGIFELAKKSLLLDLLNSQVDIFVLRLQFCSTEKKKYLRTSIKIQTKNLTPALNAIIEIFVNNTKLIMQTYLSTSCFNFGEIISCVWDTSIF